MIIYADKITPRLAYVARFLGDQLFDRPIALTSDSRRFLDRTEFGLDYGDHSELDADFRIQPQGLLFENTIRPLAIECFVHNDQKAFFRASGDFPFDIFSAIFFLLSRYEEYLPHELDEYGRYSHKNSLAFQNDFLDQPLIDTWLGWFSGAIQKAAALRGKSESISIKQQQFRFVPSYDIDEAYAYLHKSFAWRTASSLRDLLTGNFPRLRERKKVVAGKLKDPYDSFEWMDQLHTRFALRPRYFFLVAGQRGRYDKNIHPRTTPMSKLIRQQAARYPIGLHPSWRSGDDEQLLENERRTLESITGGKVEASRQHYLRFRLPDTFRRLVAADIFEDHSMGYGTINGFRASVSRPFFWYDLEAETETKLLLHPFCFMEANSFFEQKQTSDEALEEMRRYYSILKKVNGQLSMIWHNSFLGTAEKFRGWRECYERFLSEIL